MDIRIVDFKPKEIIKGYRRTICALGCILSDKKRLYVIKALNYLENPVQIISK